jgi:hypothetical protein
VRVLFCQTTKYSSLWRALPNKGAEIIPYCRREERGERKREEERGRERGEREREERERERGERMREERGREQRRGQRD